MAARRAFIRLAIQGASATNGKGSSQNTAGGAGGGNGNASDSSHGSSSGGGNSSNGGGNSSSSHGKSAQQGGGNNNDTNRFNIDTLNSQIAGFLSQLPSTSPMAVWKNYRLVSGLWTNGGVDSGGSDVQRGSLEAANTTMETFFQQQGQNCFTCHAYDHTHPLTPTSHIVSDLLPSDIAPKRDKETK